MNRQEIDLGTARDEEPQMIHEWNFLYIGDCTGDVTIKVGSKSASALDPNEFSRLTNVESAEYIYITNTAQSGKKLVIYFTEKMRSWWG